MQNSGERCREKERPYQFVIAYRLPRTTFCCKNNSMRPLQKRGKVVEQSGVRKMSPFKMQMTGNCPIIFLLPAPIETVMT